MWDLIAVLTVGLIVVVTVIAETVMAGVMMTNSQAELVHTSGSLSLPLNHRELISEATEPNIRSFAAYRRLGRLGGRP